MAVEEFNKFVPRHNPYGERELIIQLWDSRQAEDQRGMILVMLCFHTFDARVVECAPIELQDIEWRILVHGGVSKGMM